MGEIEQSFQAGSEETEGPSAFPEDPCEQTQAEPPPPAATKIGPGVQASSGEPEESSAFPEDPRERTQAEPPPPAAAKIGPGVQASSGEPEESSAFPEDPREQTQAEPPPPAAKEAEQAFPEDKKPDPKEAAASPGGATIGRGATSIGATTGLGGITGTTAKAPGKGASPGTAANARGATSPGAVTGMEPQWVIEPYLKLMVQKKASDLFFTTGSPVKIKIEGNFISVGKRPLDAEKCKQIAMLIMDEAQQKRFAESMECDFAIGLKDEGTRFRVNAFRQRGTVGLVLRRIPSEIPSIKDLNLPTVLNELVMNKRGLILMVGATGSGKSTTLAAMIDCRNRAQTGHILTIEDPIEYSHKNQKAILNQREVGVDTHSYHNALRACLREAPDVILIGEIRDRETMETTMELCNTGHLVLSTLHANNSNQALERVINLFPPELQKQVLMDLSLNIRSVISQRLVKKKDKKLCAAVEILINTPHIADLLLQGRIPELKKAMEDSGVHGMQTFDQALYNLYNDGTIDLKEALSNADSSSDLEARISFG